MENPSVATFSSTNLGHLHLVSSPWRGLTYPSCFFWAIVCLYLTWFWVVLKLQEKRKFYWLSLKPMMIIFLLGFACYPMVCQSQSGKLLIPWFLTWFCSQSHHLDEPSLLLLLSKVRVQPRGPVMATVTSNSMCHQQMCTNEEPEDVLPRFNGSCCFSQLDLKVIHIQIFRRPDYWELNNTDTPFVWFLTIFLSFGLSVSFAIFHLVKNSNIQGLVGVEGYQDDIVVYAPGKSVQYGNAFVN